MHPVAEGIVRKFVSELPVGLVERVHITGSAISGDWHEGRSDVDVVLQLARPLDVNLTTVHSHFKQLDAVYLTAGELAAGPDQTAVAPQAIAGRFEPAKPGAQLTWVTWLELELGATLDGGTVAPVFPDTAVRAVGASRRNLLEYWKPLGAAARLKFALLRPSAADVAWLALGPARLVITIEQGRIASKTEAGEFAAAQWPENADLLDRVIRYRSTGDGTFSRGDARQALDLLDLCVERGIVETPDTL